MKLKEVLLLELRRLFAPAAPTVLLLVGLPILYTILFGFTYSNNVVKYIPTVIYDQDQTTVSRSLTQAYMDSERYKVVAQVTTQEEMERWLREDKALVAVSIPAKFSQQIKLGMSSEILIETNSTNVMFANAVISSSQEIVQTFSAVTGQKLQEALNQLPAPALRTTAPVKLGIRIISNPTTSYTNFMLPGLAANGLQIAILLVAGPLIAREYSRLSRWRQTSATTLVLGKLLPVWGCATVAFIICLAIMNVGFGVPVRTNMLSLLLLVSAFTFLVINLSFFFSAITSSEVAALQVPLLYIMPGLLYSGLSWPSLAMNEVARFFSSLMPLTYMADTLRDILLAGYSPFLLSNSLSMFAGGLVLQLTTLLVFTLRRKKFELQTTKEVSP